jgi:hypothetical protein
MLFASLRVSRILNSVLIANQRADSVSIKIVVAWYYGSQHLDNKSNLDYVARL